MLNNNFDYQNQVYENIIQLSKIDLMPKDHVKFLEKLKAEYGFEPRNIYDIGSAVLHWASHAKRIWPNSAIYLFDAFEPLKILYSDYHYHMGVLSDVDDREVKYYQNDIMFAGSSYYKELNDQVFPEQNYLLKKTRSLDSVIKEKKWNWCDLLKIDAQGAELDIFKGSKEVLEHVQYIIVELQFKQYNKDAPLSNETIDYLEKNGFELLERFCVNPSGFDGDYCFKKINN